MIAPTTYDRVQYTLSHPNDGSITIKEIKNWGEDEKVYARNTDYDGIIAKFSNKLIFVEDGKDFILFINETYGPEAQIYLKKEERHPHTDVWTDTYSGYIDLYTLEVLEDEITVQISAGGIEQLLKTRETEQIEIDRTTTLDGDIIPELVPIEVPMDGRRIFLLSKMENSVSEGVFTNWPYQSFTQEKTISSDEHVISTQKNYIQDNYAVPYTPGDSSRTVPQSQQFFYFENDRTKTLKLTFDLEFEVSFNVGGSANQYVKLYIQKSKIVEGQQNPEPIELYLFAHLNGNGSRQRLNSFIYSNAPHPFVFTIEKDECLAFVWEFPENVQNENNGIYILKNDLTIEEDSYFETTKCDMVLAHDLGSRISKIITGKDCFYSQTLGRVGVNDYTEYGQDESTGFANGLMIREFERDDDDKENKFKPLTTSFRDFADALWVTRNISVGIERINRTEKIRMERKEYFYNPNVTIRLPYPISNVKRKVAKEYYFSSLEMGYAKGGEYEESMGLDEYNGKSTFTTVIKRIKNVFKAISPYRTDSYGAEFARRKTRKYYPLEDTRYDQDVFQFALKRIKNSLYIRKWQDDFETEPTGVYSPETAYNLIYSPANLILRHGWMISTGLIKYPFDYIRYGSSTANSNLTTKLTGGIEISENGGETGQIIQNKDLKKPKFVPTWVEFEHIADFEVMQQVEGFSTILGKKIPNFYGLVEFTNELGDIERGYLFSLKPNGVGNWTILKANR